MINIANILKTFTLPILRPFVLGVFLASWLIPSLVVVLDEFRHHHTEAETSFHFHPTSGMFHSHPNENAHPDHVGIGSITGLSLFRAINTVHLTDHFFSETNSSLEISHQFYRQKTSDPPRRSSTGFFVSPLNKAPPA